jgi:hypothetical protein
MALFDLIEQPFLAGFVASEAALRAYDYTTVNDGDLLLVRLDSNRTAFVQWSVDSLIPDDPDRGIVRPTAIPAPSPGRWHWYDYDPTSTSKMRFVVGPPNTGADYATIQEGINAAEVAGGGVVLVQPGVYTETLAINPPSGARISIAAFGLATGVTVLGTLAINKPVSGECYVAINGCGFADLVTLTGAGPDIWNLSLVNVYLDAGVDCSGVTGAFVAIEAKGCTVVQDLSGTYCITGNCNVFAVGCHFVARGAPTGYTVDVQEYVILTGCSCGAAVRSVGGCEIANSTIWSQSAPPLSIGTASSFLSSTTLRRSGTAGPAILVTAPLTLTHSGVTVIGALTLPLISGTFTAGDASRPLSPRVGGVVFPEAVADYLTFPAGAGAPGQALVSDGVGAMSYGYPGGLPTQTVRLATTANIVLSGTVTVDSVVTAVGDLVLVKNQSIGSQNGVYVVAAGAWARAPQANSDATLRGAMYYVQTGGANGGRLYNNINLSLITVGVTIPAYRAIPRIGTATAVADSGAPGTVGTSLESSPVDHRHQVIGGSFGGTALTFAATTVGQVLGRSGTTVTSITTLLGRLLALSQVSQPQVLPTTTVNWTTGHKQLVNLIGNGLITFTSPGGPTNLTLVLVQDATGGRTPTWDATTRAVGGQIRVATAPNSVTVVSMYFDGTNYWMDSAPGLTGSVTTLLV